MTHEATKPKRKAPKRRAASWGHAYRRFLRTGMDPADAAYRADERDRRLGRVPGVKP